MKITDNKVISFHYTVKNDSGELIDSSDGRDPLTYLHGHKNIVEGLEEALLDKVVGDQFEVSIDAEKAYGNRNDNLVQTVPRSAFEGVDDIHPGMKFNAQTEEGGSRMVIVTEVDDESVVVDGNHPLAGMNLHFSVDITEVRDASAEEIEHGHAHGPGGHQH